MIEKYLVKQDEETIVVKYNVDTNEITIGGYKVFMHLIESILVDVFSQNLDDVHNIHSQSNKVAYKFKIEKRSEIRRQLEYIDEQYILEKVDKTGRIM